MDVFLMVRRKKTTIFLDAKETTTVHELKKMVEGITKVPPENQWLFKDDQTLFSTSALLLQGSVSHQTEIMDDNKTLGDYGLNSSTAKAQAPATVGLAYKDTETGKFEPLEITPLSSPPELPDVMKPPEAQSHEQTVA